jgi:hypothetical protein
MRAAHIEMGLEDRKNNVQKTMVVKTQRPVVYKYR